MSIVKDSSKIKQALLKRLQEVYPSDKGQGYIGAKVIQDASERNFKITAGCLSRYFANKTNKSILSEEQIIWLCVRYGLPIQLIVGKIVIDNNKIGIEIPRYNESESLKLLKQIFNG
ncbi:MAG: hypothetical protein ACOVJ5_00720 [Gloeomargaritales cyanobacterium]|jgi:hypothetical protein